ncbi:hypothetical protein [Coleofasciculus sp. FACHB-SPT9]|uniref:hypothetical protein n=1 Tax=Cyanophyceae TaxID=3028117 RepID=UPI00168A1AE7|nr:hypothetical protein [Coleofasciculus sp. FACHB-SPT9]MBD1887968.1 hypothetical protein [Coleofasciculus sp. FACHB-SPT9]
MVYEHLRQIPNTPFYITPDEPADPGDCARYPDSPLCGGQPFSKRPVALKPEIVFNECAKGIKVTPVLGFVKLPPVEIIAIDPKCRQEKPSNNQSPPPPVLLDDLPPNAGWAWTPERGSGQCPQEYFVVFHAQFDYLGRSGSTVYGGYQPNTTFGMMFRGKILGLFYTTYEVTISEDLVDRGINFYAIIEAEGFDDEIIYAQGEEETITIALGANKAASDLAGCNTYSSVTDPRMPFFQGHVATYISQNGLLTLESEANIFCPDTRPDGQPSGNGKKPSPTPPPPPPKRKCDCMGCCPSNPNQDKNDRDLEEVKRLLRLLLKKIGEPQSVVLFDEDPNKPGRQKKTVKKETLFDAVKLATQRAEVANQILGIEAFPIDVPATVINPEKSGVWGKIFGFIDGKKRRKLKSIAEFIAWQSEQDAAVLGKFHQVIPIADSDATKKGDQPDRVVLPNIAETLKEIILLVANLIQSQGMMMDINLKTLTEASAVKVEVAKTQLVVKDIQEYLDYDTEQKIFDVPIQIGVPPADATEEDMANFSKFLEPSKTQVDSAEWMGRDSFQEALTDLRTAAAAIRATFSNRV